MDIKHKKYPEENCLTRRSFLKAAGATTVAVGMTLTNPWLGLGSAVAQKNDPSDSAETLVKSFCRMGCSNSCFLNLHIKDGNIIRTSMASLPDERYNRICLRGLSHAQRIYHPDRLKYPMKRVGERGSGKWERISWDEAMNTIIPKFKKVREKYGKAALAITSGYGNNANLSGIYGIYRLQNSLEATYVFDDADAAGEFGYAKPLGFGKDYIQGNEFSDCVNAKTYLCWGANPAVAFIQAWHFIREMQDNGGKLIVIDPNFTVSAAKADQWIPIRAGSDAALANGMSHVIIKENLHNKEYLLKYTVAPFLVRADTKVFLRQSDLTGVKSSENDPYVVWDSKSNKADVLTKVDHPALEGSFTVNGIKVSTAFQLLKELLADYSPEAVAKLTDINPEVITDLAYQYALNTPSSIFSGWGFNQYDNGTILPHAISVLAALTGNIAKKGASIGHWWNYSYNLNTEGFSTPTGKTGPMIDILNLPDIMESGNYAGKPYPLKAMFLASGNYLYNSSDTNQLKKALDKLDLFVVADYCMTDTTHYADIILPAAFWFEVEEIMDFGTNPFVMYAKGVIDPLYDSKSDTDIFRLLAKGLGVGEIYPDHDSELVKELIDSDQCKKMGITFERLEKEQAVLGTPLGFIQYEGNHFPTKSGRLEFYVEDTSPRVDWGQTFNKDDYHLPKFIPPKEAWPESSAAKKYPLSVYNGKTNFMVHGEYYYTPWLREIDPEPTVRLNPIDAAARGIKTQDYVEVFNDRGRVVVKSILSEAIRPGMLWLSKGFQHWQFKEGFGINDLTDTYSNPYHCNASFFDVMVEIRKK
ncbi:molybdopterin-dependent oxidoreductase [Desulfitobacterium sp.]|uniref:molybdopterin-dependent oxidoreductase n=1 Tax=Desulfitobacterium sp. TaxID=49981 RepID=UPI002B1FD8F2|nr:molybdopterin-dependent oxidoreductase [Desulfitobacterium sp.]MEA4901533.1 molybdopterin-dependent oxidoreductase [Desulfitobacterium sp.]